MCISDTVSACLTRLPRPPDHPKLCDIHTGNYHSFSISFDYCEQRDGEERTTSPNKVFEKASSRVLHAMGSLQTPSQSSVSRVRSRTNVDDANVCVVLAHFYCRKPNWSARVYYYPLLALRSSLFALPSSLFPPSFFLLFRSLFRESTQLPSLAWLEPSFHHGTGSNAISCPEYKSRCFLSRVSRRLSGRDHYH